MATYTKREIQRMADLFATKLMEELRMTTYGYDFIDPDGAAKFEARIANRLLAFRNLGRIKLNITLDKEE